MGALRHAQMGGRLELLLRLHLSQEWDCLSAGVFLLLEVGRGGCLEIMLGAQAHKDWHA